MRLCLRIKETERITEIEVNQERVLRKERQLGERSIRSLRLETILLREMVMSSLIMEITHRVILIKEMSNKSIDLNPLIGMTILTTERSKGKTAKVLETK